jgi:hypothetical protein
MHVLESVKGPSGSPSFQTYNDRWRWRRARLIFQRQASFRARTTAGPYFARTTTGRVTCPAGCRHLAVQVMGGLRMPVTTGTTCDRQGRGRCRRFRQAFETAQSIDLTWPPLGLLDLWVRSVICGLLCGTSRKL